MCRWIDKCVDGFGEGGRDSSEAINAVPPKSVLNIDLVLVSYKPVIDVVGDSKVFKKILRDGQGTSVADDGATVTGTCVRFSSHIFCGKVQFQTE